MPSWLIWVIVAVIVVALVVAIAMAANKKKQVRDREHATELRERAATQATDMQKREAHARETEAEASAARAEAERKQAEAQRLAAEAQDRKRSADQQRRQHEDHLRRADDLDPDVNPKSDDYQGPGAAGSGRTSSTGTGESGGTFRREGSEPTTITKPDGSTEAVEDPRRATGESTVGYQNGTPSSGSHRALPGPEPGVRTALDALPRD